MRAGRGCAGTLALLCLVGAARGGAEENQTRPDLRELQREIQTLREQLDRSQKERARDRRRIEELQHELEQLKAREAAEPPAARPVVTADRPNVFNPRLTIFGDALGRIDDRPVRSPDSGDERIDDTFNLREVEADFRAAIDPYADGLMILAVESEVPGEFEVAVEEGYATIRHLPYLERSPLGLSLRVGRFRTEYGRVNLLHTHDLPQSQRPLAVQEFLGPEGHIAEGLSAHVFLPLGPDEDSAWELTGQILTGGRVRVADGTRREPGWLGALRWSRVFGTSHYADVTAITHVGTTDARGRHHAVTVSLDAMYKWQPPRGGLWRSFLIGGQWFWSHRKEETTAVAPEGDSSGTVTLDPLGGFLFGQYQINRRLYAGLRADWTELVGDDDHYRAAIQPYVSYYLSEFLRLRAAWEHRWSDVGEDDGRDSVLAQLTFVFGSHPPEPFWVNR